MRDYSEYKKDLNAIKQKNGEKIFLKQLEGLEGDYITINRSLEQVRGLVINEENINSDKKEFRTLCVKKDVDIKHGDVILYKDEKYLNITDIDYHYYYKSCKIKKCNNVLKWEQDGNIYEIPCLLSNDSYGVKVLSDNDFIRSQNIKAQITVQDNEISRKIIPDMRFMFNNSEFDIYNVVDINTSMVKGVLTLTTEKSVYQAEDSLEDNLAFSKVLYELTSKPKQPEPIYTYEINGLDSFKQERDSVFTINPLDSCTFYIDDFDSSSIANIVNDDGNGTCTIHGRPNLSDNWFTLYAKDNSGNVLTSKKINVLK